MDRTELAKWWEEAFAEGVWWAPWRSAIDGLTAAQAAWQPVPGRHSIWEVVNHLIFWQEYVVHRIQGGAPRAEADVAALNWQPLSDTSDAAWHATVRRFAECHAVVHEAMLNPGTPPPPKPPLDLRYLLLHVNYHVGQIMYVRSLLGLAPLER